MPVSRSIGRPTSAASGRTRRGLTSATPRNVAAAPAPVKLSAALDDSEANRPTHMSPTPSAPSSAPTIVTTRDGPRVDDTAPSRSASTGSTRVARSAGARPASTLTRVPTTSETTIVRVAIDVAGRGQLDADGLEQRPQAGRDGDAQREPQERADDAQRQPLADHRAHDLAARGAQRAQQRELAHPLGDGDREGVEDDERADEQRDPREGEQRRGQEAQALLDVAGLVAGLLLAGADDRRAPEVALERVAQRLGGDALAGRSLDLVEAVLAEHPLGLGQQ